MDIGAADESGANKQRTCMELENVEINFLSISYLSTMKYKKKFSNMFDLVYVNNSYLKYLDADVFKNICKANAFLLIENQLFFLSHRDKQLEEFEKKIMDTLKDFDAIKIDFDIKKDHYVKFILNTHD